MLIGSTEPRLWQKWQCKIVAAKEYLSTSAKTSPSTVAYASPRCARKKRNAEFSIGKELIRSDANETKKDPSNLWEGVISNRLGVTQPDLKKSLSL
jgi:hypothetical protein